MTNSNEITFILFENNISETKFWKRKAGLMRNLFRFLGYCLSFRIFIYFFLNFIHTSRLWKIHQMQIIEGKLLSFSDNLIILLIAKYMCILICFRLRFQNLGLNKVFIFLTIRTFQSYVDFFTGFSEKLTRFNKVSFSKTNNKFCRKIDLKKWIPMTFLLLFIIGIAVIESQAVPIEPASHQAGYHY